MTQHEIGQQVDNPDRFGQVHPDLVHVFVISEGVAQDRACPPVARTAMYEKVHSRQPIQLMRENSQRSGPWWRMKRWWRDRTRRIG